MTELDIIIQNAMRAFQEGRFDEAEERLNASLLIYTNPEDSDLILQQLVHLHSHARNRHIEQAQRFMDRREAQLPLAYVALSQAYFQLHIKTDFDKARYWADKAKDRAWAEKDWSALYSASAVIGIVAIRTGDRATIDSVLESMESVVGKDQFISYGDSVIFLEAVVKDYENSANRARQLATRIAPFIDDEDFRARAEALSNP